MSVMVLFVLTGCKLNEAQVLALCLYISVMGDFACLVCLPACLPVCLSVYLPAASQTAHSFLLLPLPSDTLSAMLHLHMTQQHWFGWATRANS